MFNELFSLPHTPCHAMPQKMRPKCQNLFCFVHHGMRKEVGVKGVFLFAYQPTKCHAKNENCTREEAWEEHYGGQEQGKNRQVREGGGGRE